MKRIRAVGTAAASALAVGLLAGCGGSGHQAGAATTTTTRGTATSTTVVESREAGRLLAMIIKPPFDYSIDPSAGATGTITRAAFGAVGGVGSATVSGYVTGFRQNYVDNSTQEGLTITVMQFASPAQAAAYFRATVGSTLSLVAPDRKSFAQVPGAVELDGTKAYAGEYQHGVVMSKGPYYASVVYVTTRPVTLPMEFYDWAKVQYLNLK